MKLIKYILLGLIISAINVYAMHKDGKSLKLSNKEKNEAALGSQKYAELTKKFMNWAREYEEREEELRIANIDDELEGDLKDLAQEIRATVDPSILGTINLESLD